MQELSGALTRQRLVAVAAYAVLGIDRGLVAVQDLGDHVRRVLVVAAERDVRTAPGTVIVGVEQPGNADQLRVIVGQVRDIGGNYLVIRAAGRMLAARVRQVLRQPFAGFGYICHIVSFARSTGRSSSRAAGRESIPDDTGRSRKTEPLVRVQPTS